MKVDRDTGTLKVNIEYKNAPILQDSIFISVQFILSHNKPTASMPFVHIDVILSGIK